MNANAIITITYDSPDREDAVRYARLIQLDDHTSCEHCDDPISDDVAWELCTDADFSTPTVTVHLDHLSTDTTFDFVSASL